MEYYDDTIKPGRVITLLASLQTWAERYKTGNCTLSELIDTLVNTETIKAFYCLEEIESGVKYWDDASKVWEDDLPIGCRPEMHFIARKIKSYFEMYREHIRFVAQLPNNVPPESEDDAKELIDAVECSVSAY